MLACGECCLSGSGLCDELITRPEESYRLWCVVVCDLETSWMRRPWPTGGCCAKNKQITFKFSYFYLIHSTVSYYFLQIMGTVTEFTHLTSHFAKIGFQRLLSSKMHRYSISLFFRCCAWTYVWTCVLYSPAHLFPPFDHPNNISAHELPLLLHPPVS
jgi:hypothetical protein